jgi:uncharacterized protein YecE (DUF72 family)
LRAWSHEGTPSFTYFNNTAAGHAVRNAQALGLLTAQNDKRSG